MSLRKTLRFLQHLHAEMTVRPFKTPTSLEKVSNTCRQISATEWLKFWGEGVRLGCG